ncbi:hypothetical protein AMJ80_06375 [bacterium SM23_31]|nr:MAG: hypothetical protein AMJ80_06375 [bacterium SM23_31]
MDNKSRFHSGARIKYFIVGAVVVTLGLIFYFGSESTTLEVETFEAQKGEFVVDVVVSGEIKAHNPVSIKFSRITGLSTYMKIVKLVPEDEFVEKGDFLVQVDGSDLEDRISNYELTLTTKYQELEVLLAQQRTDSVRRENQLKTIQLNLELNKATFLKSKFEQENKRREMEISMQLAELRLLDKIDEIESKKLENIAKLNTIYDEVRRYEKYVSDYTKRLEETIIYAPVSGMVVYKEARLRTDTGAASTKEKIRLGVSVYYREPLMELTDLSEMLVETAVNEIEVGKIKRENEVIIKIDKNKKVYYGTISRIATIAEKVYIDPTNREKFRNLYTIEILVKNTEENTENNGRLKPGMSATCRIITDRVPDAVYVPIQSVFEVENETYVYVKDGETYEKTPVVIGIKNNDYVVVEEGLEPGQLVTFRDPYKKLQDVGKKSEVPITNQAVNIK